LLAVWALERFETEEEVTTITQEPVNIGPIPHCIKVSESGDYWVIAASLAFCMLVNKALSWLSSE
jgi:streptogramin lyase